MSVPPRSQWPEPEPETPAGAALTDVILETFRLNARLLEAAQGLAEGFAGFGIPFPVREAGAQVEDQHSLARHRGLARRAQDRH